MVTLIRVIKRAKTVEKKLKSVTKSIDTISVT